jgi:hypothetical protein
MGQASTGQHYPTDKVLAGRPDNRRCIHCNEYLHKDRLADHFRKSHGMLLKDVLLAVAAASRKPTNVTLPKWKSTPVVLMPEKVETPYAKKRREMKEAFREIDRSNFPPGGRLTSNFSGRLPRGGGFMSNRSK